MTTRNQKNKLRKWDERLKTAEKDLKNSDLSKTNKNLISDFVRFKKTAHRIGKARQTKYHQNLRILAQTLDKDFDKAERPDIENLVEKVYNWDYSKWTKRVYLIILKSFYGWMEQEELVDWIKPPSPKPNKVRPDEILTWEDSVELSKHAMNPRDRALPQVLWETGARISEILTLKFKDVEQVNGGEAQVLHLRESKTDIREVVIVDSAPALIEWMEAHPYEQGPLWINIRDKKSIMSPGMARRVLERLKDRMGLDKPVNPHNFRKSSATILASNEEFSEQEIKKRFGWAPNSDMLNIYVHLDDKRVTKKYLRQKGVLPPSDREKRQSRPRACAWCNTMNTAARKTCRKCKRPLDKEEIEIKDELDRKIDQMASKFFEQKMEDLRLELKQELKT